MFDLFNSVSVLLKLDGVNIDNNVCRLHHKLTVIMLIVFSLMLTSRQYFGDPIDCITSSQDSAIDTDALDTYCWIFSTFTVSKHLEGVSGLSVAQPGVGPSQADDEVIHHKYYQWVCFVLCFQAIFFYLPRSMWKMLEAGRLTFLVHDLNCPLSNNVWSEARKNLMADYLTVWRFNRHGTYAFYFSVCETLNLANVVGQMFLLNSFLGGQFLNYGLEMVDVLIADKAMTRVFPKITKCTFHTYGPTGTIQNIDAQCVLPLNIVNEKVFAFLWFWFSILAIITALSLVYRVSMLNERVRIEVLYQQTNMIHHEKIESVVRKINIGDWFFLTQLLKNMNPLIFNDLFDEIYERLGLEIELAGTPILKKHGRDICREPVTLIHLNESFKYKPLDDDFTTVSTKKD